MLQVDHYPLPNPNELMASLTGGKHFTKLDLTAAYQQMLLDDESTKLVTLNTCKGGCMNAHDFPSGLLQPQQVSTSDGHDFAGYPICSVLH